MTSSVIYKDWDPASAGKQAAPAAKPSTESTVQRAVVGHDEYSRAMKKRAEYVDAFRRTIREAMAEALDPADVEFAAVEAERAFGEIKVRELGEDIASVKERTWDRRRLLRLALADWIAPAARRSESGCFVSGQMYEIQSALRKAVQR